MGCAGFSLWCLLLVQGMGFYYMGSVVVAQGLSCSPAYGIFPGPGSYPCALHCMQILNHWTPWGAAPAESLSLTPPGSIHKQQPLGVWRCDGIPYQGSLMCKMEQVLPPSTSKPVWGRGCQPSSLGNKSIWAFPEENQPSC